MRVSCRHLQAKSITDILSRMIVVSQELGGLSRPGRVARSPVPWSSKSERMIREKPETKSPRPGIAK